MQLDKTMVVEPPGEGANTPTDDTATATQGDGNGNDDNDGSSTALIVVAVACVCLALVVLGWRRSTQRGKLSTWQDPVHALSNDTFALNQTWNRPPHGNKTPAENSCKVLGDDDGHGETTPYAQVHDSAVGDNQYEDVHDVPGGPPDQPSASSSASFWRGVGGSRRARSPHEYEYHDMVVVPENAYSTIYSERFRRSSSMESNLYASPESPSSRAGSPESADGYAIRGRYYSTCGDADAAYVVADDHSGNAVYTSGPYGVPLDMSQPPPHAREQAHAYYLNAARGSPERAKVYETEFRAQPTLVDTGGATTEKGSMSTPRRPLILERDQNGVWSPRVVSEAPRSPKRPVAPGGAYDAFHDRGRATPSKVETPLPTGAYDAMRDHGARTGVHSSNASNSHGNRARSPALTPGQAYDRVLDLGMPTGADSESRTSPERRTKFGTGSRRTSMAPTPSSQRRSVRFDGARGDAPYESRLPAGHLGTGMDLARFYGAEVNSLRFYGANADVFTYDVPDDAISGLGFPRFLLTRPDDLVRSLARCTEVAGEAGGRGDADYDVFDPAATTGSVNTVGSDIYGVLELYASRDRVLGDASKWYAGKMTRKACAKAVRGGPTGCFLLRRSTRSAAGFVLCVHDHGGHVVQYPILQQDSAFVIGDQRFPTLALLIESLKSTPIVGRVSTKRLLLTNPAPGGVHLTELTRKDLLSMPAVTMTPALRSLVAKVMRRQEELEGAESTYDTPEYGNVEELLREVCIERQACDEDSDDSHQSEEEWSEDEEGC